MTQNRYTADENYSKALQEAILACVRTLHYGRDVNGSVNRLLEIIGEFHEAQRAYIFEYDLENALTSNTYEWCAPGATAEIDNLQNVPISEIARWEELFDTVGIVSISSLGEEVDASSDEYRILADQGIVSLLVAPIELDGRRIGFIGIDDARRYEKDTILLKTVSSFIADDMQKRKMQEALQSDNFILRRAAVETNDFIAVVHGETEMLSLIAGSWGGKDIAIPGAEADLPVAVLTAVVRQNFMPDEEARADFLAQFNLSFLRERLGEDGEFVRSFSFYLPDGRRTRKQYRFTWLDSEADKMLLVCTDTTKSYLEEQAHRRELEEALTALESANQAKAEFISRISHDIRTPIGAVLNLTEFAKADVDNKEHLTEDLEKISTSGRFLLSLINDVLDISKIDSGKIELKPEPYDFAEYISEIRNIMEPMCEEKDIRPVFELQSPPNTQALWDRVRLNQITLNILSNAVKYTSAGGTVTFSTSFAAKPEHNTFTFEVRDTGIGMSEEFQARIFEEFSQETENPLRETVMTGTGLGLSIVRKLVDLMHGAIDVESRLGEGTAIRVTLPIVFDESCAAAEKSNADETRSAQPLSGRILFAEDNEINTMIAARIFEEIGVTADHAENGREAVKMFAASAPGTYKTIFMDLQMPVMNGYEAAAAIRALAGEADLTEDKRAEAGQIPIIAMTADAFTDAMEKAAACGMTGFTTKPLDPAKLREILEGYR